MECGADVPVYFQFQGKCFHKVRGEAWVPIRNDFGWDSEPREEVLEVKEGYSFPCNCCSAWEEGGCSRASLVNDSEYGILSVGTW